MPPEMAPTLADIARACGADGEGDLPLAVARAVVERLAVPIVETETLPLGAASGRVLAADLVSPIDVPAHDNAAMDGWSFASAALRADGPTRLPVAGRALAGHPFSGTAPAEGCIRITTGAVMPDGHDSVVPQELATADGERVTIPAGAVRPGQHRRRRGEAVARGGVALPAGRRLRPADLGLAASLGVATLQVRRRLRVACFSSGDELADAGSALPPGAAYDANRPALLALLARLGCETVDLGIVADEPGALAAALEAAAGCDAVVCSGGVGVGDADHTRAVFAAAGELQQWHLALRPGRPFVLGRLRGGALLFGLPGNPVAAIVVFQALVRDALLRRAGATVTPLPTVAARAAAPFAKRRGRSEYPRAVLRRGADGDWEALPAGDQGSAMLAGLSQADGLVVLDEARGPVAVGERVEVLPFDALD